METKFKNSWLKMTLIGLCTVALMFGLSTGSVLAQDEKKLSPEEQKECDDCEKKAAEKHLPPHQRPAPAEPGAAEGKGNQHGSLAEAATNPLANLVQFQLQNQYNSVVDNSGAGASNQFLIQPVIPFSLPMKWMPTLITRTTLPYISTTDLGDPIGREYGFSDTTLLLVGNMPIAKGQMIGLGTSLVFPTGGSNEILSSGKWQAGPAWAYLNTAFKGWQLGAFGWQHWDFADGPGGGKKPHVSEHSVQPLLIKHFAKGWYAGAQDIPWKYDFRTNNWSMPTGPRVGKVFKLGKLPLNAFGAVYYDPMTHDDDASSNTWSFKVNLTVLFPK